MVAGRPFIERRYVDILTETVDGHAADQIFRVGVHGGARVRADVRLGQSGDHQAQIVAGRERGGHVHSGGPAVTRKRNNRTITKKNRITYIVVRPAIGTNKHATKCSLPAMTF